MVPLASHRRVWTWLGLCKFDENMSTFEQMIYIFFNISLFVSFVAVVVASTIFVMINLVTDQEGSLHALFQFTAYTGLVYVSIIAFVVRHKISNIFHTLTDLYTTSKNFIKKCRATRFYRCLFLHLTHSHRCRYIPIFNAGKHQQ